jgi:hypothetical protein
MLHLQVSSALLKRSKSTINSLRNRVLKQNQSSFKAAAQPMPNLIAWKLCNHDSRTFNKMCQNAGEGHFFLKMLKVLNLMF